MVSLTFYPLGNADCCRIDLANGERILFDYANTRDPSDRNDRRCDLPMELRRDLKTNRRDSYRVVAFTHLDEDHIKGSSEFFYLEHARKYQDADRVEIEELWVPAAAIIEEACEGEARVVQAEGRHRLRQGKGIRVFSRPEKLRKWLEAQGLSLEERKDLITDAGSPVPGLSLDEDGVEFFVHSPFASRLDNGELLDRNTDCLVVQATFMVGEKLTKVMLGSDVQHEALAEIVRITRKKGREGRLEWDVFKIPHHCSYLSLGPERGEEITEPVREVKWLFEDKGLERCILVSTSWPIPTKGSEADAGKDPPHRQAAEYYKGQCSERHGEFKVSMEHPKVSAPEPLVIEIDVTTKARILKDFGGGAAAIISQRAPRVGGNG